MDRPMFVEELLHQFDVNAALIGDLVEQRRAGRSTLWLWRQAFGAIMVATTSAVRGHAWLALRALLVCWAVWTLCGRITRPLVELSDWPFGVGIGNFLLDSGHDQLRRLYFHYQLYALPSVVAQCSALMVASWVVARTHAAQRGPMVVLSTAVATALLGGKATVVFSWFVRDLLPMPSYYPFVMAFVLAAPCMLWAGLTGRGGPIAPAAADVIAVEGARKHD